MGWIAAVALIGLVLFWLWRLAEFRGPRLEWLGAALLVGLAGYAWQGSPVLEGRPTENVRDRPAEGTTDLEADLVDPQGGQSAERWIDFAEALNRAGNHLGAAQAIRNGLEQEPDNADLWVALGNALLLHGEGQMNPAAQLAFERAAEIDPEHPGPPFFIGLALAQAGRLDEAEAMWSRLLERTPEDAPYRADLVMRVGDIRASLGMPAEGMAVEEAEDDTAEAEADAAGMGATGQDTPAAP